MKKRFFLLNIAIAFLFSFVLIGCQYYLNLRDNVIGISALSKLEALEKEALLKVATIKLSVYSTNTNELSQVRNDIMAQFQEADFESITIQPKAAFIDSLLNDSKLKEYMNNSNLKRSNQSLLNKMKLYLPNELLISFLDNGESITQVLSIEEYLLDNEYNFVGSSSIPTVKSNVKHYYYDKALFNDLVTEFTNISEKRNLLSAEKSEQQIFEISFMILLFLFITAFTQLIDFYLLNKNMAKIKFLLKGHIDPRKYKKLTIESKTMSLGLILVFSIIELIRNRANLMNLQFEPAIIVILFVVITALINLLIFIFKKERIEL